MWISNVRIVTEERVMENGSVEIEDGRIRRISDRTAQEPEIDGGGHTLLPGFIDVHIHGAAGHDVMDATTEALDGMTAKLPEEGTTSFLATTMTQSPENISKAVRNVGAYEASGGAEVLGIHLEGPFISSGKAGAQPTAHILPPSVEMFETWQNESRDRIKLVTLAPETEGALDFIEKISRTGVVCSLGHSEASLETANAAADRGARHVTHLFNQMSGLHHREPGLVGAAFLNPSLMVEMIVDHIHVHPDAVRLAYQTIGSERTMLITDAMRAKCLADGAYDLGGQDVTVKNQEARLEDGTLAGSILKLNEAVRKMRPLASWQELARITSGNAARQLGVFDRKGSIEEGKDADLVLLDEDGSVVLTLCMGEVAYQRGESS
ncbi:N-acetylglucosamine-6-phosphate deacetylase [Halobacillus litoralis]|uniref:N-acetylglucosamine-6-phosphate deacetylase n=1 Tax=Halobacillus litoralis TaxID=45668 RepID=UPI001CD6726A|nr:N-acetylglucosamine-6-phosphate deacetylase [Halobacillus litoralis]MCA0970912.1 N-acetylglucosamine-6-phosphate deacetylase [Halobacillus litoralis]